MPLRRDDDDLGDLGDLGDDGDLPAVPGVGPGGVLSPVAVPCSDLSDEDAEVVRDLGLWLRKQRIFSESVSDDDLIKFAHSCDFDLDVSKKCAKGFYVLRKQTPEFFSGWDTSEPNLETVFNVIKMAVMPRRTRDNYRVIVNSLQTADTSNYVFVDVGKALFMTMETIFLTEPTINGIIMVHDMGLASLSHFFKFGWTLPKKMTAYISDHLPVKQGIMHLVNCSGFIDKGLRMLSHLGRKEDWDRVRVHKGDDYSELHKYISPDCLPSDLGGNLPSLSELHERHVRRLGEFKEVFRSQLP